MITYRNTVTDVDANQLTGGFFEGWTNPPSPSAHLAILRGSYKVALAMEDEGLVGFITAIGDGVSAAYIPYLEVLPAYRGRGIGSELVKRLLHELRDIYMIDLSCDEDVVAFYEPFGMQRAIAMIKRNYDRQACEPSA